MTTPEKRAAMIDFVRRTDPEQVCCHHGDFNQNGEYEACEFTIEPETFDATCQLIEALPDIAIDLIDIKNDFRDMWPSCLSDSFCLHWCIDDGQTLAVLQTYPYYGTMYYKGFWFERDRRYRLTTDKNPSLPHLLETFAPFWPLYAANRDNYFLPQS